VLIFCLLGGKKKKKARNDGARQWTGDLFGGGRAGALLSHTKARSLFFYVSSLPPLLCTFLLLHLSLSLASQMIFLL
jgi:hypothetical protein